MSIKIASKQEKTQYYTTDKTNLFSTYDAQYSNKSNSGHFYAPPGNSILRIGEVAVNLQQVVQCMLEDRVRVIDMVVLVSLM